MKKLFLFFALLIGMSAFAQTNLIINGDFSNGTEGWAIDFQKAADTAKYVIDTKDNILSITQSGKADGRVDVTQEVVVEKGETYTLSFEYTETHKKLRSWSFLVSDNDIYVYANDTISKDPFRTYNSYFEAASVFTKMTMEFSVPDVDTISIFRLQFRMYKQDGNVAQLKNIAIVKKDTTPTKVNEVVIVENKNGRYFLKEKQMIVIRKNGINYDMLGNVVR